MSKVVSVLTDELGGDGGGHAGTGVALLDGGSSFGAEASLVDWIEHGLGSTFGAAS